MPDISEHPKKASVPITVTESGILMFLSEVQALKQLSGIDEIE